MAPRPVTERIPSRTVDALKVAAIVVGIAGGAVSLGMCPRLSEVQTVSAAQRDHAAIVADQDLRHSTIADGVRRAEKRLDGHETKLEAHGESLHKLEAEILKTQADILRELRRR